MIPTILTILTLLFILTILIIEFNGCHTKPLAASIASSASLMRKCAEVAVPPHRATRDAGRGVSGLPETSFETLRLTSSETLRLTSQTGITKSK